MHEEHKKILMDSIKSGFEFKIGVTSDVENLKRDLFLKQLDFFLQLSSFSLIILSIGYLFYTVKIDLVLGLVSLAFSTINILWIVAYTRLFIDNSINESEKSSLAVKEKMDISINKAIEALNKNDSSIYFKHIEEELEKKPQKGKLNFSGEVFTFIFINAFLFLIVAFFKTKFNFCFDYILIVSLILITSYVLSFKKITGGIIEKLSYILTPKNK